MKTCIRVEPKDGYLYHGAMRLYRECMKLQTPARMQLVEQLWHDYRWVVNRKCKFILALNDINDYTITLRYDRGEEIPYVYIEESKDDWN